MKIFNNRTKKLIVPFIVVAMILPAVFFFNPKQANAFPVFDVLTHAFTKSSAVSNGASAVANKASLALQIKKAAKEVLQEVLKGIAKKALAAMTKSVVNWVNSGFHGSPLFLQNSGSFFTDIAKYEIKNVVDTYGYNTLLYPFGKDFALNTINAYKMQANENMQYTLSKAITDPVLLRSYQNDFNVGGWNGFLINTQYPQNNYVGWNMMATEQLAEKLQGTTQTATQKVQTTLQQGMGFLSPQTCPSNSQYNNMRNEWQQKSFDEVGYRKSHPYNPPTVYLGNGNSGPDPKYDQQWNLELNNAKTAWNIEIGCPGGLVNTTPGSVVSGSIMKALGASQDQASLSAAMGNSLSAIFDSLINHFLDKGLNALASTVNPSASSSSSDTWSYDGQTLGSPATAGTNDTWDAGPDEPIVLSDFKKEVADGISNTNQELKLIYNESSANPGIVQMLGNIWPKVRELDMCQPGPDIGWQDRLQNEMDRNGQKFQEKISDTNGETAAAAQAGYDELKFAVDFFKDWIGNKMMTVLPHSVNYLDAVDELSTLPQESSELTDARRLEIQTLARLESIQSGLDSLTEQPKTGSADETVMVKLKKQYDATLDSVSNPATVDQRQNELDVAKDKLNNLNSLVTQCTSERTASGWSIPGSNTSTHGSEGTEQKIFCDSPIVGGYTHGSFNGPDTTRPQLPMVNASRVLRTGLLSFVTIQLDCNVIYKANVLDYKKDLPGLTTVVEPVDTATKTTGN